ncbi:hypothetical protein Nmel_002078 [Mimus melanotis]
MEEFHPHNDEVGPLPHLALCPGPSDPAAPEGPGPGPGPGGAARRGRGRGAAGLPEAAGRMFPPGRHGVLWLGLSDRGHFSWENIPISMGKSQEVPGPMIFNADEAHNIVKECIESVLGKADYNHNKVNQWTAAIVEQSLTHLVKLGKTYKYIVTCAVMQRSGAGLHTASSCFWDTTTDGTCTVRWENRTMNCIVNVFAVAIIL